MNDPVVLQLTQAMSAHGEVLLQNPAQLERALSGASASFPGKVKALLILLDKRAVAFLTSWSKDTRPNKGSYEQVREQVATKFEQAKLLNATAAAWGLDAWAAALGLRPAGDAAAAAAVPVQTSPGLTLADADPEPAAPEPTARSAAPAAAAPAKPATAANPYAPPAAPVSDPAQEADADAFVPGGRAVAAGRGWSWVVDAWGLFKEAPMIWIVNFIIFTFLLIAIELVPLVGSVVGLLLAPVLSAGIMIGARAVHQGEPLQVGHLFAGFRDRTGPLVVVGALYLAGTTVILLAVTMLVGVSFVGALAGGGAQAMGAGLALGILVAAALLLPLLMAYWFAPGLVALNGYAALDAMKTSFAACLKNVLPFLVYGLVGMLLAVVATIPVLLGWFVLAPVAMASMYTSYRDIFYEA